MKKICTVIILFALVLSACGNSSAPISSSSNSGANSLSNLSSSANKSANSYSTKQNKTQTREWFAVSLEDWLALFNDKISADGLPNLTEGRHQQGTYDTEIHYLIDGKDLLSITVIEDNSQLCVSAVILNLKSDTVESSELIGYLVKNVIDMFSPGRWEGISDSMQIFETQVDTARERCIDGNTMYHYNFAGSALRVSPYISAIDIKDTKNESTPTKPQ